MHPREVLLGAQAASGSIPVCDHYSGVEARMVKSLALQRSMIDEFGACVFDVTLDCEDGAPAGCEVDHANMVFALANKAHSATKNVASCIAVPIAAMTDRCWSAPTRRGGRCRHRRVPISRCGAEFDTK
jgi:citrate lyase subunit beta / citryl-CoA lyase